ncbi:DUF485 domain-containing protein [Lysinibacillus sp. 3P01SB]|uniref:DUF485 domain-containing protein n=1 Tax=Lysinibacillus sp. 3P01SB TaxID=3132284 RepID=UPI0039A4DC08
MAKNSPVVDYEKIAQLESFKKLTKKKNAFLWTLTAVFMVAYMLLPVLTSYTEILHHKAIGDITWVWIYSGGLFIMTWVLAHLYVAKANSFDRDAKAIIEEYERGVS